MVSNNTFKVFQNFQPAPMWNYLNSLFALLHFNMTQGPGLKFWIEHLKKALRVILTLILICCRCWSQCVAWRGWCWCALRCWQTHRALHQGPSRLTNSLSWITTQEVKMKMCVQWHHVLCFKWKYHLYNILRSLVYPDKYVYWTVITYFNKIKHTLHTCCNCSLSTSAVNQGQKGPLPKKHTLKGYQKGPFINDCEKALRFISAILRY